MIISQEFLWQGGIHQTQLTPFEIKRRRHAMDNLTAVKFLFLLIDFFW